MTDLNKKITHLLEGQIPDYVQEYYPLFVIFVTKYFEYLENSSAGVQYTIQNLQLNRDIDTTASSLAVKFLNTFIPNLPKPSAVDDQILVKYFRQFYEKKGSISSFQLFFRAFFDDEIKVIYPKDQLFSTSSGNWNVEKSIRIRKNSGDPENLFHTTVTGNTSHVAAVVNNVVKVSGIAGLDCYELILQNNTLTGTFTSGEAIRGIYYDHVNNISSVVTMTSISSVLTAEGKYLDQLGQVSANQVLQDSLYYQRFSYVIRTQEDRKNWADTILNHLHPTGSKMFNEWYNDSEPNFGSGNTTSIVNAIVGSMDIKLAQEKPFLTSPTITFDRTADQETGTSTTRIATSTGFVTITYTNIGDITYTPAFDYPGENITWALQKLNDPYTVTEIVRPDGASFDKFGRAVGIDSQLIAYPLDVNTSLVITRYISGSSVTVANVLLTSFSSQTLTYNTSLATATSVGSMIMIVNWSKNARGNSPAGESNNAVVVSFSSNVTLIPFFGEETQRNYQRIAFNDSLPYNSLVYVHSSNSITVPAGQGLTADVPFTATSITGQSGKIIFKPFNHDRGVTFDRLSIRFAVDQPQQLNTSLSETFDTDYVTGTGLIASWGGTTASAMRFTSNMSSFYAFSSNAFVFNGTSTQVRFLQTPTFTNVTQLNAQVRYIVGDGYNGGEIPDTSEDLEIQYSINGGSSYLVAHRIWQGSSSNLWTFGTTSIAGKLFVKAGGTRVTGINTIFATDLSIGDIITINSSLTTGYTITNILNNNVMDVTPALVDNFLGLTTATGTVSGAPLGSTLSGIGTAFNTQFTLGDRFALSFDSSTTAYTITNIIDANNISIAPVLTSAFNTSTYYAITGINGFLKLPASEQFATTSVAVYGPGPTTSVIMRIIQLSQTTLNDDVYAIDRLDVQSLSTQATTGVVNISVSVSSNSTLNISDTDFFTVTTIGT